MLQKVRTERVQRLQEAAQLALAIEKIDQSKTFFQCLDYPKGSKREGSLRAFQIRLGLPAK